MRMAVFRPSNGNWYIKGDGMSNWGDSQGNTVIQCGTNGDVPVPGDYFNEGKQRIAVWRPSDGNWYIKSTQLADWGKSQGNIVIQAGTSGDIPVPGDYFGEGILRIAVWRPSNGNWYIKGHGNSHWGNSRGNLVIQAGMNGDVPVPADYYSEGHLRIAVWRPSNGNWYIKGLGTSHWGKSEGNHVIQCGTSGDIPLTMTYD